ncbi:MAG: glutathione S-transferase family protein [Leptothrix sp. (in: b-proteobacteria)]
MKLYVSARAPNPRRVQMFLAEKGLQIETVEVAIMSGEHRSAEFLARNPLARVPVLELDDGRCLSETRAICNWFEGRQPEPNLMGLDADERAFIEMHDRRAEFFLLLPIAHWIRHCHPGLAPLEQPQFPDFGAAQRDKLIEQARVFDTELARQPYWAGERFTVADITAFCALEFARGLMKFRPGNEGLPHLQAWRDRINERPSAKAGM